VRYFALNTKNTEIRIVWTIRIRLKIISVREYRGGRINC
jgi:hypothetical protein